MFFLRHDQLGTRVNRPRSDAAYHACSHIYIEETERALCGLFPRCRYIPLKRKLEIKFYGEFFVICSSDITNYTIKTVKVRQHIVILSYTRIICTNTIILNEFFHTFFKIYSYDYNYTYNTCNVPHLK